MPAQSAPGGARGVGMSGGSAGNGQGTGGVERAALLDLLRGKLSRAEAAQQAGLPESGLDAARDALLAANLPPASLTLRGVVGQPVRIVRDGTGTPHVYAETARDLFVGYGFALAQDRLWQIDYYRRRAPGGVAGGVGPSALPSDRRNRLLGFGMLADQEVAALTTEEGEALDGFAAGINAWIDRMGQPDRVDQTGPGEQADNRLPIEFE